MRTIILYRSSYKGNTLKIAQSMADALSAELVSVDNTPTIDLSGYDLIGFGSAINFAATISGFKDLFQSRILMGKMFSYFPPAAVHSWGHIINP